MKICYCELYTVCLLWESLALQDLAIFENFKFDLRVPFYSIQV